MLFVVDSFDLRGEYYNKLLEYLFIFIQLPREGNALTQFLMKREQTTLLLSKNKHLILQEVDGLIIFLRATQKIRKVRIGI